MKAKYKELEMMLETIGAPDELKEKCVSLVEKLGSFEDYIVEKEGITSEGMEKIFETYVQIEMNKKMEKMNEEEIMKMFSESESAFTKNTIGEIAKSFAKKYEYDKAEEFGESTSELMEVITDMNKSITGGMFKG